MMAQPGFYVDSSACSGCKACQLACKDKNHLPDGILWRRVYEISGGRWTRRGNAWITDVFAYNLSLACNHCERPICVEVCPTGAMTKRADGLVLIQASLCVGCTYCQWACPYAVPQYDPIAREMTKCNGCTDNLDLGIAPACVSACPLRSLDFGPLDDLKRKYPDSAYPYPLPRPGLTQPALVVKHHKQALRAMAASAEISNTEVVAYSASHDYSLIAFTLLAQMAIGSSCILAALQVFGVGPRIGAWIAVFATMLSALAASLAHLGKPGHAWRAIANVRSSWLSREILSSVLFTAALGGAAAISLLHLPHASAVIWSCVTAVIGLCLLACMLGVYRLRTIPAWNSLPALVIFSLAAPILGAVQASVILVGQGLAGSFSWLSSNPILLPLILLAFIPVIAWQITARRSFYLARTLPLTGN